MATWTSWNNAYITSGTSTTSCTSTATNYVWSNWIDNATTAISTSSTTANIWYTWNSAILTVDSGTGSCDSTYMWKPKELTESEQLAVKEREEERKRLEIERLTKEKLKEETARELLREVLTEEQNDQFDEKGYFELTALNSGNKYRINRGRTRNVQLLDKNNEPIRRLCFHPMDRVHDFDTMVAQKLMIETNEEQVKQVANYS